MPGPPKQFNREAALALAMNVFWQRGFEATSIDELVKAVGVNRSSMYATFGDKQSLFLEALQLYGDRQLGEFSRIVHGRGKPLNRIRKAFRQFAAQMAEGDFHGCFAGKAACELGSAEPKVASVIADTMRRWVRIVKDVLDEAVAAGDLPHGSDTEGMAVFMLTFAQGLGVVGRMDAGAGAHALIDAMLNAVATGDWTRR